MEPAFIHRLADDVPVDGLHHVRARGILPQVEFAVEREQLKRVVMLGRGGRGPGGPFLPFSCPYAWAAIRAASNVSDPANFIRMVSLLS